MIPCLDIHFSLCLRGNKVLKIETPEADNIHV